jgi:very-short-patch-repair endonuclease
MPATTTVGTIPLTTPEWTVVDLATQLPLGPLIEAANAADRHGLTDHNALAALVESLPGRSGVRKLRIVVGATAVATDSVLERRFLKIVAATALPPPETQVTILGYRVDFLWPSFKLVVETDGLTYHRTPAQQAADRRRDQVLTAAGFTVLRFTNAQVRDEPLVVRRTLRQVVNRAASETPLRR